jgi:3-oxoacyl-[acyl-carrier-protein] synthase III
MIMANALVTSGTSKKVPVCASEVMSKVVDYSDRNTCILFADGAGAALVEYANPGVFLAIDVGTEGMYGNDLVLPALRTSAGNSAPNRFLKQNGREVYKWAVSTVPEIVGRLLRSAGLTLDQVKRFVPHGANLRIIEAVCDKIGFPLERTLWNLDKYGNTASASIPLAMAPAIRSGRVKRGDTVMLVGFRGGLVWSGAILTF